MTGALSSYGNSPTGSPETRSTSLDEISISSTGVKNVQVSELDCSSMPKKFLTFEGPRAAQQARQGAIEFAQAYSKNGWKHMSPSLTTSGCQLVNPNHLPDLKGDICCSTLKIIFARQGASFSGYPFGTFSRNRPSTSLVWGGMLMSSSCPILTPSKNKLTPSPNDAVYIGVENKQDLVTLK